jgi:ABC-2 type transport system ATP-binding protein
MPRSRRPAPATDGSALASSSDLPARSNTGEPIIQVRALSRRFGAFVAVDAVSFEVQPGEIFGYLGANGAGKSTTIRMLCGLLAPTSGQGLVAGVDVGRSPEKVKRAIGYMSQKFSLYVDLTVEENLGFFAGVYGIPRARRHARIEEALRLSDLGHARGSLTGELPGGIRQRLALASALLHEPRVLFLDEPTAGVDPIARRTFWRTIRQLAARGTTLFVTTHHLDEAEYSDRVGFMVDGRLVALDTPAALKQAHVPGTIHEVSGEPRLTELGKVLARLPEVLSVRAFGAAAHVRVTDDLRDPAGFERLLRNLGFVEAIVGSAEPTLEDVFLEVAARPAADGSPNEPAHPPTSSSPDATGREQEHPPC